jgi:lipoyl synthase
LLKDFRSRHPRIPTKSGLMVGLGETDQEIHSVMRDLRAHGVDMLTIGQYLRPSAHHLPVVRYAEPAIFDVFARHAREMGFTHAACGPLVRSSYHADRQAHEAGVS